MRTSITKLPRVLTRNSRILKKLKVICAIVFVLALVLLTSHNITWLNTPHSFVVDTANRTTLMAEKAYQSIARNCGDFSSILQISRLKKRKQKLEELNAYLLNQTKTLENENAQLRKLAKFIAKRPAIQLSTQLITYPHIPLSHRCTINAGTSDSVQENAAVMSYMGVIGRVITAHKHSSDVLLITDASSRVPVYLEGSQEHAILAGQHAMDPQIVLRQNESLLQPGQRVVTSGKCGIFPPGLLVGYTSANGNNQVTLAQNSLHNVSTVLVLETHYAES